MPWLCTHHGGQASALCIPCPPHHAPTGLGHAVRQQTHPSRSGRSHLKQQPTCWAAHSSQGSPCEPEVPRPSGSKWTLWGSEVPPASQAVSALSYCRRGQRTCRAGLQDQLRGPCPGPVSAPHRGQAPGDGSRQRLCWQCRPSPSPPLAPPMSPAPVARPGEHRKAGPSLTSRGVACSPGAPTHLPPLALRPWPDFLPRRRLRARVHTTSLKIKTEKF